MEEQELSHVYAEIDGGSQLLWAQEDNKQRGRTRSKTKKLIQEPDPLGDSHASISYGEVTKVSVRSLLR